MVRTRFSAPGGPEINSSGYLDVASQQFSVYNSINFRNLTTRGDGSGEDGTIRVNSHSNREGLRTLRSRHQVSLVSTPNTHRKPHSTSSTAIQEKWLNLEILQTHLGQLKHWKLLKDTITITIIHPSLHPIFNIHGSTLLLVGLVGNQIKLF